MYMLFLEVTLNVLKQISGTGSISNVTGVSAKLSQRVETVYTEWRQESWNWGEEPGSRGVQGERGWEFRLREVLRTKAVLRRYQYRGGIISGPRPSARSSAQARPLQQLHPGVTHGRERGAEGALTLLSTSTLPSSIFFLSPSGWSFFPQFCEVNSTIYFTVSRIV